MNEFIHDIKHDGISSDEAMEEIVVKLIQKGLKGGEKCDGHLDAYDSEEQLKGKLYNGNIYIFEYAAKNLSKYTYKGTDVYYADDMPVLLLLGETAATITGINLNFCNKGLRALILNQIQNIDVNFYNGGDLELYDAGKPVISNKVLSVLNTPGAAAQLHALLKKIYEKADYSFIFRTYSKSNIQKFRMIEPWQWKYIPFLNYYGTLKKDTLDAIHKLSGIFNITV